MAHEAATAQETLVGRAVAAAAAVEAQAVPPRERERTAQPFHAEGLEGGRQANVRGEIPRAAGGVQPRHTLPLPD